MAESEDLGVTGVASGEQPSQSRQHESTKHTGQRHEGTLRGAGPARERPGTLGGRVFGTLGVHLCGITTNPTGEWVTQQARNLASALDEAGRGVCHLIRDRDAKFTRSFDDVWTSIGAQVLRIPVRAPNANAFAERWVGTARRECLDHLLIVGPRHLGRVLSKFVEHDNGHRPHRALGLVAPEPRCSETRPAGLKQIVRRDVLAGLIHEYDLVA